MKRIILVVLTLVMGLPFAANALPIGSFDTNVRMGSSASFDQIHYTLEFGGDFWFGSPGGTVFDLILSTNDVGKTYTVASGTEFAETVGYLTNGLNDQIAYDVSGYPNGGGAGSGSNEAYSFFGDYTGAHGIDFAGYTINSISLMVNNLNFNTPGDNPNRDGLWTDVIFDARVTVDGSIASVPEPGTFVLLTLGLACIGFVSAYRRRSRSFV